MTSFIFSLQKLLNSHRNLLIIAGNKNKIDNLACSYALALVAEKRGRNVSVLFAGQNLPEQLRFLNIQKFTNNSFEPHLNYADFMFVGTTKEEIADMYTNKNIPPESVLNINTDSASYPLSEKVTYALKEINENLITDVVATSLLTGIIAATQNFQNPHIRPQTLFASAYLISKKARNELAIQYLYKTKTLEAIRLWGSVIANFSYIEDMGVGWSFINHNSLKENGFSKTVVSSLLNELKNNFGQAKIIILGIEHSPGESIAVIHAPNPLLLEEFCRKGGVILKNSSCVMKLNPNHKIQTATIKAVEEVCATL